MPRLDEAKRNALNEGMTTGWRTKAWARSMVVAKFKGRPVDFRQQWRGTLTIISVVHTECTSQTIMPPYRG